MVSYKTIIISDISSPVCHLSVMFVRPMQATENLRNVSTPFGTLGIR